MALPTPRVAATLLLIVMGFGVVVAGAASPNVDRTYANAARGPLRIILPPRAAPAPAPAPSEPDTSEPAETPAPAEQPIVGDTPVPPPARGPATPPGKDDPITGGGGPKVPPVGRVFVISLGPGTYEQWFGDTSTVPYLRELADQGTLLTGYEAVANGELSNQVALISGLTGNDQTEQNCPAFCPFTPDDYTLPDQLVANGATWKAYIEGQDATPAAPVTAPGQTPPPPDAQAQGCRRPENPGDPDPYNQPGRPGDPYVTWRNPFVYFPTITTTPDCATADVGLTPLEKDLEKLTTTASFSWIAPAPENSRPPAPPDPNAPPAAPTAAEAFLRSVVPEIMSSEAYRRGALIAIVPDATGTPEDRVTGALLLGKYVPVGSINTEKFTHLSLLKGVEDLFTLRYLAGAQDAKVKSIVSLLLH